MVAKIAVIYSSTYGHIRTLAETIAESVKETGAEVTIFQFPEILSDEVLAKMHAAPKAAYPIVTSNDLVNFDGFLFGIPTRYGRAVACASAFFDTLGGLWGSGALVGKSAGIFTSAGSQHGGLESTALTTIPFLAHMGIVYHPIGFVAPALTDNTEIVGGSAYGAAAIAGGDGSRGLTEKELSIAKYQGTTFGNYLNVYVRGNEKIAAEAAAKELNQAAVPVQSTSEAFIVESAPNSVPDVPAVPVVAPMSEKIEAKKLAPTPAAKKSGGIFAMCCGGGKDNYET